MFSGEYQPLDAVVPSPSPRYQRVYVYAGDVVYTNRVLNPAAAWCVGICALRYVMLFILRLVHAQRKMMRRFSVRCSPEVQCKARYSGMLEGPYGTPHRLPPGWECF